MTFFNLVLAIILAIILLPAVTYLIVAIIGLLIMVFVGIWTIIEGVWNKITK